MALECSSVRDGKEVKLNKTKTCGANDKFKFTTFKRIQVVNSEEKPVEEKK